MNDEELDRHIADLTAEVSRPKLFMVQHLGWGESYKLVRARDEREAREMLDRASDAFDCESGVDEVSESGDLGVLWECDIEGPDTD